LYSLPLNRVLAIGRFNTLYTLFGCIQSGDQQGYSAVTICMGRANETAQEANDDHENDRVENWFGIRRNGKDISRPCSFHEKPPHTKKCFYDLEAPQMPQLLSLSDDNIIPEGLFQFKWITAKGRGRGRLRDFGDKS